MTQLGSEYEDLVEELRKRKGSCMNANKGGHWMCKGSCISGESEGGPIKDTLEAWIHGERSICTTTPKAWEVLETYNTNVVANLNMVQAFLDLPMPTSGKKTIINVTSGAAHVQTPGQAAYGSSKATFARMLQHLANERKSENVKIFTVHPGTFDTPLAARHFPSDAFQWEDISLVGQFCTWVATSEAEFLHGRFVWAQWDVDELIAFKDKMAANPEFMTIELVQ
ncbi:hypothetical protein B0A55_07513 [Friedmanniomyces simplex]|uniref:Uncharacterized protein n=1 Tax=Friedmanniomyces simplex TaxID=329884 RepID=A0A4U0Y1K7_9PEZI|nr:hypothetical protein B0A55_07513 [Friedmanniomyces simplex]